MSQPEILPGLVPLNMALFNSVTVDAETISLPASLADGDVGVFADMAVGASTVTGTFATNPAGWTIVIDEYQNFGGGGGQQQHNRIFYKLLTAAESSGVITGSNYSATAGVRRKGILVFRGNRAVKTLSAHGTQYQSSAAAPTDFTLNRRDAGPGSIIGVFGAGSNAAISHTLTPAASGTVVVNPLSAADLDYKFFPGNSVESILSQMTDAGASNSHWGFWLRCLP